MLHDLFFEFIRLPSVLNERESVVAIEVQSCGLEFDCAPSVPVFLPPLTDRHMHVRLNSHKRTAIFKLLGGENQLLFFF